LFNTSLFGQIVNLDSKITLDTTDLPLINFLSAIESKYHVAFVYTDEIIKDKTQIVKSNFHEVPLIKVINEIFDNPEFSFFYYRGKIIIKKEIRPSSFFPDKIVTTNNKNPVERHFYDTIANDTSRNVIDTIRPLNRIETFLKPSQPNDFSSNDPSVYLSSFALTNTKSKAIFYAGIGISPLFSFTKHSSVVYPGMPIGLVTQIKLSQRHQVNLGYFGAIQKHSFEDTSLTEMKNYISEIYLHYLLTIYQNKTKYLLTAGLGGLSYIFRDKQFNSDTLYSESEHNKLWFIQSIEASLGYEQRVGKRSIIAIDIFFRMPLNVTNNSFVIRNSIGMTIKAMRNF
jgi:hypothetical protein